MPFFYVFLFNVLTNYALATELDTKPQPIQVATLLTVIGEDCRQDAPDGVVEPSREKVTGLSVKDGHS